MVMFRNGEIPDSVVSVILGSGADSRGRVWEFRCTPASAARWAFAKRYAEAHFGRTIYISSGANFYRSRAWQDIARSDACASGNCAGAAVPGSSSHGGNWNGRDCLAVDVDRNGLSWDQVDEAMEAAGFSARLITEAMSGIPGGERWHYIDFNAFGAVPAFEGSTPFPIESEEDTMRFIDGPNLIVWPNGVLISYPENIYITIKQYVNYPTHPEWSQGRATFERELWAAFDFAKNAYAKAVAASVAAAVGEGADDSRDIDKIIAGVLAGQPKSWTVVFVAE